MNKSGRSIQNYPYLVKKLQEFTETTENAPYGEFLEETLMDMAEERNRLMRLLSRAETALDGTEENLFNAMILKDLRTVLEGE